VSKRERKAPLACLAQDRGEAIRRKVLKLVGIEGEVAAILLRDVGAALGSLGEGGRQEGKPSLIVTMIMDGDTIILRRCHTKAVVRVRGAGGISGRSSA